MSKPLAVIAACILLAGCANSTRSENPPTGQALTPPASETGSSPTPSSQATPPPTSIGEEPTEDHNGGSLVGLPDCNWQDLGITLDFTKQAHTPEGEMTGVRENGFVASNSTGQDCVVRDAPQVKLIDGSGHMMWPAFLNVQPAEPLPWVLPDGFSVLFYFQIQDNLFAICPQTAEKVETARFAFSNGTVINVPVRKDGCTGRTDDCVWACADDPALPKVDMTMSLVQ
ncbi:hypothetical protein [Actinobaculum suis]|uniref:hypothetical protein n=1 Tax=Actinobaculum suis TaxID=1657 RepID=UPI000ADEFC61|nr:hypothetical protein [Actinobaculum suis]